MTRISSGVASSVDIWSEDYLQRALVVRMSGGGSGVPREAGVVHVVDSVFVGRMHRVLDGWAGSQQLCSIQNSSRSAGLTATPELHHVSVVRMSRAAHRTVGQSRCGRLCFGFVGVLAGELGERR